MALSLNQNRPQVLWMDVNSSFCTSEAQSKPLLRNRPIGVGKYTNPNGPVISISTEAKAAGLKGINNVRNCKLICPDIVIIKSDPPKYREMYARLIKIMRRWSPEVIGKSIDEMCVNFNGNPALRQMTMQEIGMKIKEQIREECGEYVRVSIGIATNQFLAKTAAGMKKPDGLVTIDHTNLREALAAHELEGLCGINTRNKARLNRAGIFTPLEFLDADPMFLHKEVFGSVIGRYWSLMLHGYEHQSYTGPERRSYGNSHSIRMQTADPKPNLSILCQLCEEASRRMRRDRFSCRSVVVYCFYADGTWFRHLRTKDHFLYTTKEIFTCASLSFNRQSEFKQIHKIAVRLFTLGEAAHDQLNLFEDDHLKQRKFMDAADKINLKYGRHAVYIAPMHDSIGRVDDSISFGSTGDVHQLVEELDAIDVLDNMEEDAVFEGGFSLPKVKEVVYRSKTDSGKVLL
jgi:DNA polymerase-4